MKVVIVKCQATVPRCGQQEMRRRLKEEFRKEDPKAAAEIESKPSYTDPDGPYGGDDYLRIEYEWIVEPNESGWCVHSFTPLHLSWILEMFACGPVRRYTVEEFPTCEYSYPLTASFALALLQQGGILPADAVLANETDVPLCCAEDEAA